MYYNPKLDVLLNICKNGLPDGNVFEYASFLVLNYEKKWFKILLNKEKHSSRKS